MEKYILFKNIGQDFAIDVKDIDRIIEFQVPKKIPESVEYLLGIIKYEDSILPVIDLNKRLYGETKEETEDTKIIVVAWKDRYMGIVVDDILGINDFEEESYEKSNIDTNVAKEYITGFIKSEEGIIIVLNIDEILSEHIEKKLIEDIEKEAHIN